MIAFLRAVIWPTNMYAASDQEQADFTKRLDALSVKADRYRETQSISARLEAKSGVLLTHVSLMVALTGALWAIEFANKENLTFLAGWFFGLHLVVYLFLALACIRCQAHIDQLHFSSLPTAEVDRLAKAFARDKVKRSDRAVFEIIFSGEVLLREKLYRFALISLYLVTAEFALAVLLEILPIAKIFDIVVDTIAKFS